MATIINNDSTTPAGERVVRVENSSDAGWVVAVVVLIALLLAGGYLFMRYRDAQTPAPSSNGGANINVTIPSGTNDTNSNSGPETQ